MLVRLSSLLLVCFTAFAAGCDAPLDAHDDVDDDSDGICDAVCSRAEVCVDAVCRDRCLDNDGDGACADFDLDDGDATVSPFTELGDNGIDDNGDGRIDEAQLCTTTDDCSNRRKTCFNGTCHYSEPVQNCSTDADCDNGFDCAGGLCAVDGSCAADVDCGDGAVCRLGACRLPIDDVCFADASCGAGGICIDGICHDVTPS